MSKGKEPNDNNWARVSRDSSYYVQPAPQPAPADSRKACPVCQEPSVCDHLGWEYEPDKKLAELRAAPADKPDDRIQAALRGIRDIVKGRCDRLDLEIIREIINEAIGHEQV